MSEKIQGKAVYNDVIDEVYELEDAEELIEERRIKNQLVDGEVNVSDDSQNYIQTPREGNSEIQKLFNAESSAMPSSFSDNRNLSTHFTAIVASGMSFQI